MSNPDVIDEFQFSFLTHNSIYRASEAQLESDLVWPDTQRTAVQVDMPYS